MGGAVSTGDDNDELVDNLVDADYIKSLQVERIFRAVDRANYFLPDHVENAYKDLAWKHGHLHLSAPCIYSEVLESLELRPGLSFLNLGSGTGYLSTMAGLILGSYGTNHGVEMHESLVEYAEERLEEFKAESKAFEEFDFCEPQFVAGNCLQLNSACRLYDRVYCGAACPPEHENYMRNLIKVDGILVMPLSDQLLQIRRVDETTWVSRNVLPVSFATLQSPAKENTDVVDLPECHVLNLQEICRHNVRTIIRDNIVAKNSGILRPQRVRRPPKPKRNAGHRGRQVSLFPMQVGMLMLNNFNDSSDDIDDEDDEDEEDGVKVNNEEGSLKTSDDDGEEDDDEGIVEDKKKESHGLTSTDELFPDVRKLDRMEHTSKRKLRQDSIQEETEVEAAAESMSSGLNTEESSEVKPSTSSSSVDNKRSSPSSFCEDGQGDSSSKRMRCVDMKGGEEKQEEVNEDAASSYPNSAHQRSRQPHRELSSEDSDMDSMDVDPLRTAFQAPPTPTSVLNALHLLSIPRKVRCSSSNSVDTSETSGFGSFGDEPLDLHVMNGDRDTPPSMTAEGDFTRSISVDEDSPPSLSAVEDSPASSVEYAAMESLASIEQKDSASKISSDSDNSRESTATKGQYTGPRLGQLMKEHIQSLPLPHAIRVYLLYYRN